MAEQKYTKKELFDFLKKHEIDGKVPINALGEIVFDARFPDELFQNAKDRIIKVRDDEKRYKELAGILLEKNQAAFEIVAEINALSDDRIGNFQSIRELEESLVIIQNEVSPIEREFKEIKARIDERNRE